MKWLLWTCSASRDGHTVHPDETTGLLTEPSFVPKPSLQQNGVGSDGFPWRECMVVLALCLSPLSKGYVTGYMSPTLNELVTTGLLPSSFAVDFFAAAIYIGSALSCFVSGWYADKFGRRGALMASAVPLFCGWVLITGQWGCAWMLVGRLLNGFGSAVVFTTFGIYVAETVAASRRGAWTVLGEASISAGALLALSLGQWLNARWLAVVAVVVAVTVFVAVSQVPETPRYYLEHNRIEDARRSLDWIRGAPADAEFAALKAQLDDHPSHKDFTCRERMSVLGKVRCRLAMMMTIMVLQGMSGHVAVNAYLQQILGDGGLADAAGPFAIGIDGLRVIATIIAGLTVERFGRKRLFVGGGLVQAAMLATLAAMFMTSSISGHEPLTNATTPTWPDDGTVGRSVTESDDGGQLATTGRLSLVCVAVFMSIYSFGWACVPSILNAELFPQPVRSVAASICSFVGLTSGATCSYIYGPLVARLGNGRCFAILAAVNLAGSLFATATLPETKGRSLEDIDEMLGGHDGHFSEHCQDLETGQFTRTPATIN